VDLVLIAVVHHKLVYFIEDKEQFIDGRELRVGKKRLLLIGYISYCLCLKVDQKKVFALFVPDNTEPMLLAYLEYVAEFYLLLKGIFYKNIPIAVQVFNILT